MIAKYDSIISKSVFIFSILIISFSLISVIFPALIVRSTSGISFSDIDPFELGLFSIPFIASNSAFFILFVLYKKNKLNTINRFLYFLRKSDLNKPKSILILLLILSIYVGFSYGEIFENENIPDRENVIANLENWRIHEKLTDTVGQLHTNLFFLTLSEYTFHNMRVIPFLTSIGLLVMVYFFTNKLTSKNYTGLVSVIIVIQSFIFRAYDTTITYSNFWIFFYCLSLYIMYKAWPLSSFSFIVSFFAKPVTITYVPITLFHIIRNQENKKKNFFMIIPYVILLSIGVIFLIILPNSGLQTENLIFHPPKFFSGFTIIPYQLRYDLFIMMALPPINFLLYKKSQEGYRYADSIQLLISGVLFSGAIMVGTLNYQLNPYRLQPLIIFFAIGVGLLLGKRSSGNNQMPR